MEKTPNKFHVRSGDTVKVISGNDKGKTGRIVKMLAETQRAIVEGVNIRTKHVKPTANTPQGELKKIEGSIHISNLMVVDPSNGQASRTGRKLNDKSKLQRFSKKSGKFIPDGK